MLFFCTFRSKELLYFGTELKQGCFVLVKSGEASPKTKCSDAAFFVAKLTTSMLNAFFLALVFFVFVAYLASEFLQSGGFGSDDSDSGNDGGWEGYDGDPPLDLPPGVFILPPDADDPSVRRPEQELSM